MADELKDLQARYLECKEKAEKLKNRAHIFDHLERSSSIEKNLKEYGATIEIKLSATDAPVSFSEALERTKKASEAYDHFHWEMTRAEEQLLAHPDDRVVVGATSIHLGKIIVNDTIKVVYLDEVENRKKTEIWTLAKVAKWHTDRGLAPPPCCVPYRSPYEDFDDY